MKVSDVRISAQLEFPTVMDSRFTCNYINSGIKQVCNRYPNARKVTNVTILCEDIIAWYDVITDIISIKRVEKDGCRITDFRFDEGKILFAEKGTYTVYAETYPDPVENDDSVLTVPIEYQNAFIQWAAAKERGRIFGINDPNAIGFEQKFWNEILEADKSIVGKKRTSKRIKAPNWG